MPLDRFSPPNLFSLSQQDRVAWGALTNYLPLLAAEASGGYATFDTRDDGFDFYGIVADEGDTFMSRGLEFTGNPPTIYVYSGATWGWMAWDLALHTHYLPTLTGGSIGDGTTKASFLRIGRQCTVDFGMALGASSTITGGLVLSLPQAANSELDYTLEAVVDGMGTAFAANASPTGTAEFVDSAGPAGYTGFSRIESATTWRIVRLGVSGANIVSVALAAGAPFVWSAGDTIYGRLTYELAN